MSNTRRRAVLGVPVVVAAVLTAVPAQATEPDPVVTVAGSTATYVDRGVDDPTRAVTGTLRTWIAEDDHDHDARSAGIELADGRLLPLEEGVAVPQRFEGGRVTAEVAGPRRVGRWLDGAGPLHRVALYARHGDIGAAQLRSIGAPEIAARWAEVHHHPDRFGELGLPSAVVTLLDRADQV